MTAHTGERGFHSGFHSSLTVPLLRGCVPTVTMLNPFNEKHLLHSLPLSLPVCGPVQDESDG